jgi:hypothetical protein
MPSFESLFRTSKGKPIEYQGRTVMMRDVLPVSRTTRIKLVLESSKSTWRQGVMLRAKGSLRVADHDFKSPIVLWIDTAPRDVEILVLSDMDELEVRNVWDVGDGTIQSWHNGAAMTVEEVPDGRRYRCNDGHPDDDFSDLVFSLKVSHS